jgi:hypothetical protein
MAFFALLSLSKKMNDVKEYNYIAILKHLLAFSLLYWPFPAFLAFAGLLGP